MCADQFILLSMITPRNLVLFVWSIILLLISILKFVLSLILVRWNLIIIICFLNIYSFYLDFNHILTFSNSVFKICDMFVKFVSSIKTDVSSVNKIEKSRSDDLEMFFMYMIKSRGPRIEPWGTPCVIIFVSDFELLYST